MKYIILSVLLGALGTVLAYNSNNHKYCHDTETGKYRRIRSTDNPRPMMPHGGRSEFYKPHLECNPQR